MSLKDAVEIVNKARAANGLPPLLAGDEPEEDEAAELELERLREALYGLRVSAEIHENGKEIRIPIFVWRMYADALQATQEDG